MNLDDKRKVDRAFHGLEVSTAVMQAVVFAALGPVAAWALTVDDVDALEAWDTVVSSLYAMLAVAALVQGGVFVVREVAGEPNERLASKEGGGCALTLINLFALLSQVALSAYVLTQEYPLYTSDFSRNDSLLAIENRPSVDEVVARSAPLLSVGGKSHGILLAIMGFSSVLMMGHKIHLAYRERLTIDKVPAAIGAAAFMFAAIFTGFGLNNAGQGFANQTDDGSRNELANSGVMAASGFVAFAIASVVALVKRPDSLDGLTKEARAKEIEMRQFEESLQRRPASAYRI